jgi:hypothetical protein
MVAPTIVLSGARCDGTDQGDDNSNNGGDNNGPIAAADLAGWWVIQQSAPDGSVRWGTAEATLQYDSQTTLDLSITMNEGGDSSSYGSATLSRTAGGIAGTGSLATSSANEVVDSQAWQGSESADHNTLSWAWNASGGPRTLTLFRASAPDATVTGVWTRSPDGVEAIVAYDGTLALSIPSASPDWRPVGQIPGQFDGIPYAGTAATMADWGEEGFLLFANKSRLLCMPNVYPRPAAMVFDRSPSQSSLNGWWVGVELPSPDSAPDRNQLPPERSRWLVVAYHDTLYVHEARGIDAGLERTIRAGLQGDRYVDSTPSWEWSGQLSPDSDRIIGEWTSDPGSYVSADRTVAPTSAILTGSWTSISLDWANNDAISGLPMLHGPANVNFDGSSLQIVDSSSNGAMYVLDATWVTDHFEGSWWDAADPSTTSPWRGELTYGGTYLHGDWANGEYSFSMGQFMAKADLAQSLQDGQAVLVLDPYGNIAAAAVDRAKDIAVTEYRDQTRITGFDFVRSTGTVKMTVDERARPVQWTGFGQTVTVDWSDDSTTAQVAVTDDSTGQTTRETVVLDLSDAACLAALGTVEQRTGVEVTSLRQWIAENPGRVQAVAQGSETPDGQANGAAKTSTRLQAVHNPRVERLNNDAETSLKLAGIFTGIIAVGVVSGVIVTASTVAIVLGACALVGFGAVIMLILIGIMWGVYEGCCPCGLACFLRCCALAPNR